MGKQKTRPARVEESLEIPGVGSLSRAGRLIALETQRTPEEHEALTKRLAEEHPRIENEIQRHVDALAREIPSYDPLDVLHRAYTDFFSGMLGKAGEHEVGFSGLIDVRMLDYTQSIIVSRPPTVRVALDEDSWSQLRHHMSELFTLLLHSWPLTHSAALRLDPSRTSIDEEEEDFRIPLLLEWLSVRGSRYTIHERERAEALLHPHDHVLQRLFGVDSSSIAQALEEIHSRLSKGLGEAMRVVSEIHRATFGDHNIAGVSHEEFPSDREAVMALLDRTGRRAELEEALGRAFGRSLFDVTELLPTTLLQAISLSPGEDREFFAEADYSGWPLRTPPTSRRPALRIEDKFYVFNPYSMDDFYRAIEQAVVGADPSTRQGWNEGQKKATEALPVALLSEMLPGATIYRDVEYPFRDSSGTKWCECDAVILLDGMLLAVEVKAGRATHKSPLEATAEYVSSVRNLLLAPAKQADRFVRYVEADPEVALYNAAHQEVGRLRRDEIDFAVRCAVTADSLSAVSGLFQHRSIATSGDTVAPTWCLSIDDLYAYRDVLRGPTLLYHFLRYRLQAFNMSELAPLDELDHLGAYLETNAYVEWIGEMNASLFALHGYRASLDEYFGTRWETGQEAEPPTQPVPTVLREIIARLEDTRPAGYLRAGAALLDLDGPTRDSFASLVMEARREIGEQPTSRVVTPFTKDTLPVFVAVMSEHAQAGELRGTHRNHALSQLVVTGSRNGVLIEAWVTEDGAVRDAASHALDLDGIPPDQIDALGKLAASIAARRFEKARRAGVKIGRNDLCLCGSGLKYKKCCLRR